MGAAFVQDTEEGGYASMYPQAKKIQKYFYKNSINQSPVQMPIERGEGEKKVFSPNKRYKNKSGRLARYG